MQIKLLALSMLSAIMVLSVVVTVSAFSFEFYYFETDKLVYEVGETINMVAKLTADFDDPGWCYVSFSVVTDSVVFSDGYYLNPSPSPQFATSSYLIHPNDITPGENGTQATVVFSFDYYDERFSQAGSSSVLVNITRGHLETIPLQPLDVETNTNVTLAFRISSTHNSEIVLAEEPVKVVLANGSMVINQSTILTDRNGTLAVNWSYKGIVPGTYNIFFSNNGTNAFLPFNQSFSLTVEPAASYLYCIRAPREVYCRSSDGEYIEWAEVAIEHVDKHNDTITDSIVTWRLSNFSGELNTSGNGTYYTKIPFSVDPGIYDINVTALNPMYKTALVSIRIRVIPRPLSIELSTDETPAAGSPLNLTIHLTDNLTSSGIPSITYVLNLRIGNETLSQVGITDAFGCDTINLMLPSSNWGYAFIEIIVNETVNYNESFIKMPIVIYYRPNITACLVADAVLGMTTNLHCMVSDPNGTPLSGIMIIMKNSMDAIIAKNWSDISGISVLSWVENTSFTASIKSYHLQIIGNASNYQLDTEVLINIPVRIPVNLTLITQDAFCRRGQNVSITFTILSHWLADQPVDLNIRDLNGTLSANITGFVNGTETVTLAFAADSVLGPHSIIMSILNNTFYVEQSLQFDVVILGEISYEMSVLNGFYGEGLQVNLSAQDDTGKFLENVNATLWIDGKWYLDQFINLTSRKPVLIPLSNDISPGEHQFFLTLEATWLAPTNITFESFLWIRTSILLDIQIVGERINSSISSGSIISPPPILFNCTISISSPTARRTSNDSCPKFSSGTSNLSTVLANDLVISVGNGHRILNLSERASALVVKTSSTDLDVHPNEIIPHSAWGGPEIMTSVSRSFASAIFFSKRRTR